ncbi:hypothetical protein LC087_05070 [Bacillus carboniphilus]|uniref:Uncharacterized protein n=1 Tax=Bacillus carboniphilus TaxID=86663 RepID=A0ABY9JXM7_9BACI|nr:hypothetical protein [Bacillus carboniphilus]WLR43538.1 hypothetical protein LC087_05070 [Bacillus carboniphilus]
MQVNNLSLYQLHNSKSTVRADKADYIPPFMNVLNDIISESQHGQPKKTDDHAKPLLEKIRDLLTMDLSEKEIAISKDELMNEIDELIDNFEGSFGKWIESENLLSLLQQNEHLSNHQLIDSSSLLNELQSFLEVDSVENEIVLNSGELVCEIKELK